MFNPQLDEQQETKRKVNVFRNNEWVECEFTDLKKDDSFRMFDDDGSIVEDDKGNTEFVALSDPYINDIGILEIEIEDDEEEEC